MYLVISGSPPGTKRVRHTHTHACLHSVAPPAYQTTIDKGRLTVCHSSAYLRSRGWCNLKRSQHTPRIYNTGAKKKAQRGGLYTTYCCPLAGSGDAVGRQANRLSRPRRRRTIHPGRGVSCSRGTACRREKERTRLRRPGARAYPLRCADCESTTTVRGLLSMLHTHMYDVKYHRTKNVK